MSTEASTPGANSSSTEHDGPVAERGPVQVPDTLKVWAGMTWRILVILAGFAVLFTILGQIAIVLIALFLAAFFTALAGPIMNFLRRRAKFPKPIAMIISIILIAIAVVVVFFAFDPGSPAA